VKYYIIAGEASGDLHASNLIREIKKIDDDASFRAWGGDLMESQGARIIKHYRDLAFMGFAEVLFNLRTILGNIKFCKEDLLENKPDVLILVDYPGFNLRIAEFAHKNGIKVFYYISPQVWAWKKGRVHKIKRVVDEMFTILPFERDFYAKYDYKAHYLGHPLLDALSGTYRNNANVELKGKRMVALLPGSRKQEIKRMLTLMLSLRKDFPDVHFTIAGAPGMDPEYYDQFISDSGIDIVFGETYKIMAQADAALVTSGTATLEAALIGVPEVLCYKGNPISIFIAKRLVDLKYIGLPNLIMDDEIVPELIQQDCNYKTMKRHLDLMLNHPDIRKKQLDDFEALRQKLGGGGASKRIAEEMIKSLRLQNK
jgi:lipid-A-disaccharide synthase